MYNCFCDRCNKLKTEINDYYCLKHRGVCEDCLEKGYNKRDVDLWAKYRPKNLGVDKLITE